MPQELQKHLRGDLQGAVESSLVAAELGFNEGPEKEGVYKVSDGSACLHFPSAERLEEDAAAAASGARMIGFAPPEGMIMRNVQDAITELHAALATGEGHPSGGGTADMLPKWVDGNTLGNSSALSETMTGISQKALSIAPVFTSEALGEMTALQIRPDVSQISSTTLAAGIRIKTPVTDGVHDGIGRYFGLFIEQMPDAGPVMPPEGEGGEGSPGGELQEAWAIYVEGGSSRFEHVRIDSALQVTDAMFSDSLETKFLKRVIIEEAREGLLDLRCANWGSTPAAESRIETLVLEGSGADSYFRCSTAGFPAFSWSFGLDSSDAKAFVLSESGILGTDNRLKIATGGAVTIPHLAGTGTRMVVADANGNLSTQPLP